MKASTRDAQSGRSSRRRNAPRSHFFRVPSWRPGALHAGDGVSAPRVTKRVEAEYTSEARDRKIEGTVILYVEITEEANPENIRVVKRLGAGLAGRRIHGDSEIQTDY